MILCLQSYLKNEAGLGLLLNRQFFWHFPLLASSQVVSLPQAFRHSDICWTQRFLINVPRNPGTNFINILWSYFVQIFLYKLFGLKAIFMEKKLASFGTATGIWCKSYKLASIKHKFSNKKLIKLHGSFCPICYLHESIPLTLKSWEPLLSLTHRRSAYAGERESEMQIFCLKLFLFKPFFPLTDKKCFYSKVTF